MCCPALLFMLAFNYMPMFGIIIAFKTFRVDKGILGSPWSGLNNFRFYFTSQDAWRTTRNTVTLNFLFIAAGLVISLLLAVLISDIKSKKLTKTYQTAMFFPYFVSWVVAGYMVYAFLAGDHGIFNKILLSLGMEKVNWYMQADIWPAILLIAHIWKDSGYYCIIYYAGIMGIDETYYEAAKIDGASRFTMMMKITIPLLSPLISIMLILQIGKIFYADFGMFFHLTKDIGALYKTTDVIDTYVYRSLRVLGDFGMASAAGLYQSVVGFILVILTNTVVGKIDSDNKLF